MCFSYRVFQNELTVSRIVKNDEPEGYHGYRDSGKIDYIQQISEPDDIANVVAFLASDLSKAINAQMLLVRINPEDGGLASVRNLILSF